eukprot:TRINITY_DN1407_c0_g1_i1.p1 TRINITY_DN1407_c0_g1~~TRINITY_DN1407_c0_g1_i1.p1  ORF type:complete len:704 (+),score=163.21 TRINITY_DN1407_c0_g1_i1:24-2114(+)
MKLLFLVLATLSVVYCFPHHLLKSNEECLASFELRSSNTSNPTLTQTIQELQSDKAIIDGLSGLMRAIRDANTEKIDYQRDDYDKTLTNIMNFIMKCGFLWPGYALVVISLLFTILFLPMVFCCCKNKPFCIPGRNDYSHGKFYRPLILWAILTILVCGGAGLAFAGSNVLQVTVKDADAHVDSFFNLLSGKKSYITDTANDMNNTFGGWKSYYDTFTNAMMQSISKLQTQFDSYAEQSNQTSDTPPILISKIPSDYASDLAGLTAILNSFPSAASTQMEQLTNLSNEVNHTKIYELSRVIFDNSSSTELLLQNASLSVAPLLDTLLEGFSDLKGSVKEYLGNLSTSGKTIVVVTVVFFFLPLIFVILQLLGLFTKRKGLFILAGMIGMFVMTLILVVASATFVFSSVVGGVCEYSDSHTIAEMAKTQYAPIIESCENGTSLFSSALGGTIGFPDLTPLNNEIDQFRSIQFTNTSFSMSTPAQSLGAYLSGSEVTTATNNSYQAVVTEVNNLNALLPSEGSSCTCKDNFYTPENATLFVISNCGTCSATLNSQADNLTTVLYSYGNLTAYLTELNDFYITISNINSNAFLLASSASSFSQYSLSDLSSLSSDGGRRLSDFLQAGECSSTVQETKTIRDIVCGSLLNSFDLISMMSYIVAIISLCFVLNSFSLMKRFRRDSSEVDYGIDMNSKNVDL